MEQEVYCEICYASGTNMFHFLTENALSQHLQTAHNFYDKRIADKNAAKMFRHQVKIYDPSIHQGHSEEVKSDPSLPSTMLTPRLSLGVPEPVEGRDGEQSRSVLQGHPEGLKDDSQSEEVKTNPLIESAFLPAQNNDLGLEDSNKDNRVLYRIQVERNGKLCFRFEVLASDLQEAWQQFEGTIQKLS